MNSVLYILGIPLITVVFICIVIFVEVPILEDNPPQLPENVTVGEWLSSFQFWALICVGSAALTSFIWCGFGQKVFKANDDKPSGKRGLWGILFLIPALAIIFSILFIEQAENESWLAYVCFIVNGLVPYYLATLFFSPTSVKYTPIGSMIIRRF